MALILLLAGDVAFFVLNLVRVLVPGMDDPSLSLGGDRGYAEMYQYFKILSIVVVLVWLSLRSSLVFLWWALVFSYLLIDDIVQVHEQVGDFLGRRVALLSLFGERAADVGEITFAGLVALGCIVLLGIAYRQGSESFRHFSRRLALLVFLLALFGVVIDFVHGFLMRYGPWVDWSIAVIEDGGEMVVTSVIVWYCYSWAKREARTEDGRYLASWHQVPSIEQTTAEKVDQSSAKR